ncbi:MAG: imidazolonepropionase [Saprospiraceae bacterium]|nr:imidazolonepropionase [Saprospiraceae bacterium]
MANLLLKNCQGIAQINRQENGKPSPFLRGKKMSDLPFLHDAWLLIENGEIKDFGPSASCPDRAEKILDANGRWVLPSFCDSHTHLVFAKPRSKEFVARIQGKDYAQIAVEGGGILNSARHLTEIPSEKLLEDALERIQEIVKLGTGLVEIKSGYGLSPEGELKMLRIIRDLKEQSPIPIKATFLAAHALPVSYKNDKAGFLRLMIDEVLPQVAAEGLADYVDIFCETGFFSSDDTTSLLEAALKHQLKGKIHTNQFTHIGGIEAAHGSGALSVDHLEVLNDSEIELLASSELIPTLLPQAPFFLNDEHFPPMRKMIDRSLGFALASDFNPGSSPSGNMQFVLSLSCIKGRITPEEALNAATYNGACALESQDTYGSIDRGKKANLILTKPMQELSELPYYFGTDMVEKTIINGKVI